MGNKRILAKVKKLMAMVERGNPHESANAMKKVQALMAEHQLSSEDVALSGIDSSKVKAANNSERQPKWSLLLVSLVRQAFGVEAIMCHEMAWGRNAAEVMFIGPADRVEIAGSVYTVLARQLKAARGEYISTLSKRMKTRTKTARADLFCEGWCNGVYHKITALVPTEQESQLVAQYIEKHLPNLSAGESRAAKATKRDQSASLHGWIAAQQVELNAGVGGQEQAKLGVA
ncbi:hypothetical protein J2S82_003414 [Aeromonas caviae]|uniref:DUF2786 domain-containing protein n=1 Tax=Aeromonas caviae TaxID=648 RepID=UPI0020A133F2|nr:DUF2786 domain-containing protein [Aeromonas caviae]MCP1601457.1 hypothetical protein [Aeromonas caviae]